MSDVLVYAPDCKVLVSTEKRGVVDLSGDISSIRVSRRTNAVSKMTVTLHNKGLSYTGTWADMNPVIRPNDRIICYMKRIEWVQVFSGYVDRAPRAALTPSLVTIDASCTLKRLEYTYVDQGLQAVSDILTQNGRLGNTADAGFGQVIYDLVHQCGSWDSNQIFVGGIPTAFMTNTEKIISKMATELNAETISSSISTLLDPNGVSGSSSGTTGALTNTKGIPSNLVPIIEKEAAKYNLDAALVAAVIQHESNFSVTSVGKNSGSSDWGLMQINDKSWKSKFPGLWPTGWQDPTKNMDAGCYILSQAVKSTHGDLYNACRWYNGGKGGMALQQTADYAKDVMAKYKIFSSGSSLTSFESQASPDVSSLTTRAIPVYGSSPSSDLLKSIYGSTPAQVESQLVSVSIQGHSVRVHKLCAAAFQAVDKDLTALSTKYTIKSIGTYVWRNKAHGSTLSLHSFGIAVDINPIQNPMVYGALVTDIPEAWRNVWKSHGFGWGGDWNSSKDAMHFQWQGGDPGGTYTNGTSSSGTDTTSTTVTPDEAYKLGRIAAFNVQWRNSTVSPLSTTYIGERALLNDTKLLSLVGQACQASLRCFSSSPQGDFISWFPDYYGVAKRTPYFEIRDIEIKDTSGVIYHDDGNLATHVFLSGDTDKPGSGVTFVDWLSSAGVITIDTPGLLETVIDTGNREEFTPDYIFTRYGQRPKNCGDYSAIRNHKYEAMVALQQFMVSWASQFYCNFEFTFMPELFPGSRVKIVDHDIAFYIESVDHTFDWKNGCTTSATLIAPSTTSTRSSGLPYSSPETTTSYDYNNEGDVIPDWEKD